jgi:hypothetical protein
MCLMNEKIFRKTETILHGYSICFYLGSRNEICLVENGQMAILIH